MAKNNTQPTELIELNIEPIYEKFYNSNSAYGIYACYDLNQKTEYDDPFGFSGTIESYEKITIIGNIPKLVIGKKYICQAEKFIHKTYGEQYKIHSIYSPESTSQDEEQDFLRTILTERQVKNIIEIYPMPVTAIVSGEFDYNKVKGIGKTTFEKIKEKVEQNHHLMKALSILGKFGISYNQIKKIVDTYGSGDLAIEKIFDNPYILYKEVDGIGFFKADNIAKSIGFNNSDYKRILAGIMYALEQEEQKGNTWGYIDVIKDNAEKILDLHIDNIKEILQNNEDFYVTDTIIALRRSYYCEMDIAEELFRIKNSECKHNIISDTEVAKYIFNIEGNLNIQYTDEQKRLFYEINKNNVVIMTGSAGCGKTFSLNGCLNMLDKLGVSYVLAAPTAKAAKVIEKQTKREASTIHRLLEWTPEGFMYNQDNPLDIDLVIVDESSMIDIWLFRSLLRAISSGSKLLIVGDYAQLESVATGNILLDIINSNQFPIIKLDKVFRQALDSGILSTATEVRYGNKFYDKNSDFLELGIKKDCKVWFGNKEDSAKRIALLFKECLKKHSIEDIMVISPMKNGNSGVKNLNNILQEIYNPVNKNKKQIDLKRCIFREGDKVMHIKNDYKAVWLDGKYKPIGKMGIFNGDTGIVKEIDLENRIIYVDYGEKIIEYYSGNFDQLELAYCITCHKSQGSQSKIVIGTMDISHYMNLKRSLLYTLITRASEYLYLVAERRALDIAIKNNALMQKKTFLELLLKNYNNFYNK